MVDRNKYFSEFISQMLIKHKSYQGIHRAYPDANPTTMSSIVNGHRVLGYNAARNFEKIFGLEEGYFDGKFDPTNGWDKWHIPTISGVFGDSEQRVIHGRTLEPMFTNGDVIYIRKDVAYDDLADGAIVALNGGTYTTKVILPDGSFAPAPDYYGVVTHRIVTFLYN